MIGKLPTLKLDLLQTKKTTVDDSGSEKSMPLTPNTPKSALSKGRKTLVTKKQVSFVNLLAAGDKAEGG